MTEAAARAYRRLEWLQLGTRLDGSLCPAADSLITDELSDLWKEMSEDERALAVVRIFELGMTP
jgi:hypothetical protein